MQGWRLQIQNTFGKWLSQYPWSVWGTFTFRFPVENPYNAKRYFWRYLENVKQYYETECFYFIAVEKFICSDGTHIHGLLYLPQRQLNFLSNNIYVRPLWEIWFKRYGRAKIELYDSEKGASYYLAKYITKDIHDWDLHLDKNLKL